MVRIIRDLVHFCLLAGLASEHSPAAEHLEVKAVADFIAGEQNRLGGLLHYSQAYFDDHHEHVDYHGTLYTAMRRFESAGGQVEIQVVVQDRFSGTVTKHKRLSADAVQPTGPLVDDTVRVYDFALEDLQADKISDYAARPDNLLNGTGFRCEEDTNCGLEWIRLTATNKLIRAREIENGI